jgi:hypothetical protein
VQFHEDEVKVQQLEYIMHRSLAAAFLLGLVAIGPNIADVEELAFLQTDACEWYGIWLICVGPRNNNQNAKGISSVLHILAWQKRLFDSRSIRPWGFMTWWTKASEWRHEKTIRKLVSSSLRQSETHRHPAFDDMLQDVVDEECTLILLGTGSVDSFGIIQKVSRIFGRSAKM